jgi:hypothetical protein
MGLRLLVVCACAVALTLAPAAGAATDSYDGVAFAPFTLDAANGDCVPWDEPGVGPTRNCDPINVLFPGQSLAQVVTRLHAAGWTDANGSVQFLHFADAALFPVQAQLQVLDGPDPTQRYHVRLWQAADGLTLGNVHHEHGSPHRIDTAWDTAEAFLAAGLCSTWCGHVPLPAQAAIEGPGGLWRGWPNDAVATVVPLAPPVPAAPAPPRPAAGPAHRHRRHRR